MEEAAAGIVGLIALLVMAGFMLLYMAFAACILGLIIFWIIMLVDAIQREYSDSNDKLMWILIVLLTGWIGAIIYYVMVKRKSADKKLTVK